MNKLIILSPLMIMSSSQSIYSQKITSEESYYINIMEYLYI